MKTIWRSASCVMGETMFQSSSSTSESDVLNDSLVKCLERAVNRKTLFGDKEVRLSWRTPLSMTWVSFSSMARCSVAI